MNQNLNDIIIKNEKNHSNSDKHNFPNGYKILNLSNNLDFKLLKNKIFRIIPNESEYYIPKLGNYLEYYKYYPTEREIEKDVDFSTIYYLDDIVKKIPEIAYIIKNKEIQNELSNFYNNSFNSGFAIYHMAIYRNYKTEKNPTGYLSWHRDGFPYYVKKILIYLDDILTEEDGPTQIRYSDGTIKSIFGVAGTVIFFDMNYEHRGLQISNKSKNSSRNVIFLSLCPYKNNELIPIQSLNIDVLYPIDLENIFKIKHDNLIFI